MKHLLQQQLATALAQCQGITDAAIQADTLHLERGRDAKHGDYASNVALQLAKTLHTTPRALAERIVAALPSSPAVAKVEIAGPGFINFFLAPGAVRNVISEVITAGERYGESAIGAGATVHIEFVSANPTGPLHVGHGRGAAYGAAVANLLRAIGCKPYSAYYVNDAGRQMDILAASVWLRYLELAGEVLPFPANAYQGDYVWDIGADLHRAHGDALRHPAAVIMDGLPADEPAGGDKELYIDAVIQRAQKLLGTEAYRLVFNCGLDAILRDIRRDLSAFGVEFDVWDSERELTAQGAVEHALGELNANGSVYTQDGALWFRASAYGDEKDRVIVRENGHKTYFATDIAYHLSKYEQGFERVIDIWGADHHGYAPRIKAALTALGRDPTQLKVLLVQFAVLYRGGEKVQMSTRSGEFVSLRELCNEVGKDAARYFYVQRRCDQHLDFDLDLAKSTSSENPVFYIQYAHARICSVLRQAEEKHMATTEAYGDAHVHLLTDTHEAALITTLSRYAETVESAARQYEPHQVAHYLRELANDFHVYYNAVPFLIEDAAQRSARLHLICAVRQVLANGLRLLGVSAPETM